MSHHYTALTQEQYEFIYDRIKGSKWELDEEGGIVVYDSVEIREGSVRGGKLPVKFSMVYGAFICRGNGLVTLQGFPTIVRGGVNVLDNPLQRLDWEPIFVDIGIFIHGTDIPSEYRFKVIMEIYEKIVKKGIEIHYKEDTFDCYKEVCDGMIQEEMVNILNGEK